MNLKGFGRKVSQILSQNLPGWTEETDEEAH
jgi:hypothetical protein